jgi:hypothetical protein
MSAFVPFYDFAAVASISMSQPGNANDATRNSVEPVRRSSSRAFTVHSLKGAVNRVIIDGRMLQRRHSMSSWWPVTRLP